MIRDLNQERIEGAVSAANDFLQAQLGASLDGDPAARKFEERMLSVGERAMALLRAIPHPKYEGYYVPLSKYNVTGQATADFDEAAATLPGYRVLLPGPLVGVKSNDFFPAVVSEDGLKEPGTLRLHVHGYPYRRRTTEDGRETFLSDSARVYLAGAGQSETKDIGEDGTHGSNDALEAGHFPTIIAAGMDSTILEAWQAGSHINHAWRESPDNSAIVETSKRLGGPIRKTVTITRDAIARGDATIWWHKDLDEKETNDKGPDLKPKSSALVVVQALGFEELKRRNPKGLETVKRLIG